MKIIQKIFFLLLLSAMAQQLLSAAETTETTAKKSSEKGTAKKAVTKKTQLIEQKIKQIKRKKKLQALHKVGFHAHIKAGAGFDSNPYLTPSQSYVDYSTALQPTITPIIHSGFFTPISFEALYGKRMADRLYLSGGIKFDGKFFYDAPLQNANTHTTVLDALLTYYFQKYADKKTAIALRAFYGNHYEIYIDHDNGEFKNTKWDGSGTDIQNRYQYTSVGAEVTLYRLTKKMRLELLTHLENLDYPTPPKWSALDHTYFFTKAEAAYSFNKKIKADLMYRFSIRDYVSRPSFYYDATVITLSSNTATLVPLTYTFNDVRLKGEYAFTKNIKTSLSYLYSHRQDSYLGYGDSDLNKLEFKADYKANKKISMYAKAALGNRTYPVALAYDKITVPAQPSKYYYSTMEQLGLSYKINKKLTGVASVQTNNQESSDLRYVYDHFATMLAIKYQY